jgi:AcrR family transcriptional regulator
MLARFERGVSALLAADGNVRAAADALNCSPRTIFRWLRNKEFERLYADAVSSAFRAATRRLRSKADRAVDALFSVIGDGKAPRAAQVSAADCVLRHSENTELLDNYMPRLEKLEEENEPDPGL